MPVKVHRMHLNLRQITRSSGGGIINALAYNLRTNLYDKRTQNVVDFRNYYDKPELTGWSYPDNISDTIKPISNNNKAVQKWWNDYDLLETEKLFNRYQKNFDVAAEKIASAKLGMSGRFSVSKHIPQDILKEVVEEIIKKAITDKQNVVTHYAIHLDKEHNPHVHFVSTFRKVGNDGKFSGYFTQKKKEYLNYMTNIRAVSAEIQNKRLKELGIPAHVEWRSNKALGLDLAARVRINKTDLLKVKRSVNLEAAAEVRYDIEKYNTKIIQDNPQILLDYLLLGHRDENDREQEGILARDYSTFKVDDIKRACSEITGGNDEVFDSILPKLLSSDLVVLIGKDFRGNDIYSSRKYFNRELDLIKNATEMRSKNEFKTDELKLNTILTGDFAFLSDEQKAAVRHMVGAEGIALVQGAAGVGKTTMMKAASSVWADRGYRVRGAAIAWKAARNLAAEAGIDAASVAAIVAAEKALENAEKNGTKSFLAKASASPLLLKKNDVLIIDEAGMVDVASMNILLKAANKVGAKIVAVGDKKQFAAINAGASFELLQNNIKNATIKVETIQRQSADLEDIMVANGTSRTRARELIAALPEKEKISKLKSPELIKIAEQINRGKINGAKVWRREAASLIYNDKIKEGIDEYDKRGKIKGFKNTDNAIDTIVEKYFHQKDAGEKEQAIYAFKNTDVDNINLKIRNKLKSRGELIGPEIKIGSGNFSVNDKVIFNEGDKTGDILKTNGERIVNGDEGKIISIKNGIVSVELKDKRIVNFNAEKYKELKHAYAMTLYKSQGQTIDGTVHILADNCLKRDGLYVALTRSKQQTEIYYSKEDFNNKDDFIKSISRKPEVDLAHGVISENLAANLVKELNIKRDNLSKALNELNDFNKLAAKEAKENNIDLDEYLKKDPRYSGFLEKIKAASWERELAAREVILCENAEAAASVLRQAGMSQEQAEVMAGIRAPVPTQEQDRADQLVRAWIALDGDAANADLRAAVALAIANDPAGREAVRRARVPPPKPATFEAIKADKTMKRARPPVRKEISIDRIKADAAIAFSSMKLKDIKKHNLKNANYNPSKTGFNSIKSEIAISAFFAKSIIDENIPKGDHILYDNKIYLHQLNNNSISMEIVGELKSQLDILLNKDNIKIEPKIEKSHDKNLDNTDKQNKNIFIDNNKDKLKQETPVKPVLSENDIRNIEFELIKEKFILKAMAIDGKIRSVDVLNSMKIERRVHNNKSEIRLNKNKDIWFEEEYIKNELLRSFLDFKTKNSLSPEATAKAFGKTIGKDRTGPER